MHYAGTRMDIGPMSIHTVHRVAGLYVFWQIFPIRHTHLKPADVVSRLEEAQTQKSRRTASLGWRQGLLKLGECPLAGLQRHFGGGDAVS